MSHGRSIPPIPSNLDPAFRAWARALEQVVLTQPRMSTISTTNGPNSSAHTGDLGDILVDVGSASTRLWIKTANSSVTQGWSALSWI